jgi:hypothetical protein
MDPPAQLKPMQALSKLSDSHKRLVNKLIVTLHQGQIEPKIQSQINKTINRAKHTEDDGRKRYNNGYMHFYKNRFPEAKKSGDSITVIAKRMGKEWKALTAEERQVYNDSARTGK